MSNMSDVNCTYCDWSNNFDVIIYNGEGEHLKTVKFDDLGEYESFLRYLVEEENCSLSSEIEFPNGNRVVIVLDNFFKMGED